MKENTLPDWVKDTIGKYISKKENGPTLPSLGRNLQAEVTRIQAVIDTVSKYDIPVSEVARLKNRAQVLLNVLDSKQ